MIRHSPKPAPRQIITMILGFWEGQLEVVGERAFLAFLLPTGIFKPTHSCLIWSRKKKIVNGPFSAAERDNL